MGEISPAISVKRRPNWGVAVNWITLSAAAASALFAMCELSAKAPSTYQNTWGLRVQYVAGFGSLLSVASRDGGARNSPSCRFLLYERIVGTDQMPSKIIAARPRPSASSCSLPAEPTAV